MLCWIRYELLSSAEDRRIGLATELVPNMPNRDRLLLEISEEKGQQERTVALREGERGDGCKMLSWLL
jgi:hypothetical protein